MKVKKFKNLWLMGLILFSLILIGLYIAKIFFPNFVVGVAQIPAIVKFGEYIDNNLWAYYLFNFVTSFIIYYFYCCACCRKKLLSWKDCLIVTVINIILFVIQRFVPEHYLTANFLSLIILPCVICVLDKRIEIKYFYSTCIVFTVHTLAQLFSLLIRDISTLISYPNSATYFILLIDMYVWLILLYNYFNFKETK